MNYLTRSEWAACIRRLVSLNAMAPVAGTGFKEAQCIFFKKIIVYLEASEHDQVESSFEEANAPFK